MESVGQKLRDARLRKQLALEDVSAATKINLRNLQAIETDELTQICSPFTYRSFARQFANFVQVDWAELDAALGEMSSRIPEPLVPGEGGAPLPPAVRPKRNSRLRWVFSIGSLVLVLVLCSTVYSAWQSARQDMRGAFLALANSFKPQASSKPQPAAVATLASRQISAPHNPAASVLSPKAFRIELSALEASWVSVNTDGKEVFSGTLEPSETKVLDGEEEARIRTGNAGGVTVNFNGRSLGTLGRRGEVRTVVFNRDGYEVLEHAAHIPRLLASGE